VKFVDIDTALTFDRIIYHSTSA